MERTDAAALRIAARTLDTDPLTERAPAAAVRSELRRSSPWVLRTRTSMLWVLGILVVLLIAVVGLAVLLGAAHEPGAAVLVPTIAALVVGIGFAWWVLRRAPGSARSARMHRFAQRNGLSYLPLQKDPEQPGVLFARGIRRQLVDVFRSPEVEIGTLSYRTQSWGDSRTTPYRRGYIEIRLPRALPHIVLVRRRSLVLRDLLQGFDREQRLSLEGDWDRSFTLYCPAGYQRDALYLFSPEVMAQFIDSASEFDAEIVDDRLFLYAARPFKTDRPQTWADLQRVVDAIGARVGRWARWRDERVEGRPSEGASSAAAMAGGTAYDGDADRGEVAEEGRRLHHGITLFGVLAGIGAVVYAIVVLVR